MSRGTILVVEDEPKLLFILLRQLTEAGFEVLYHESGEGALRLLQTHTPDLVLLNILLTGMDGVEVCKQIRADPRLARIPVIFLTARKDAESRARCFGAGANDYVVKPWTAGDLVSHIDLAIDEARTRTSDDE